MSDLHQIEAASKLAELHEQDAPVIVDYFAGMGGASQGIDQAIGISPFVAVNHCHHAILSHGMNHSETVHLEEDVFAVDIKKYITSGKCWLAWFSPSCQHFSRARGGKPKDTGLRGMADVAVIHARNVDTDVIMMENVSEFTDWGPLLDDDLVVPTTKGKTRTIKAGQADPRNKGVDFDAFLGDLRALGYVVEWKLLVAADYGAPTIRKRFFMIARKDGQPIEWPAPTHSKSGEDGKPKWVAFHTCIEWDVPAVSIFEKKKMPVENSLRRIAEGFKRYVVEDDKPFIVAIDNASSKSANAWSTNDPLNTVVTENRFSLVAPVLATVGYGERKGQKARVHSVRSPQRTVVGANKELLTNIHLTKYRTGSVGSHLDDPCPTVTSGAGSARPAGAAHALGLVETDLAPVTKRAMALLKNFGGVVGHSVRKPAGTVTCIDHHTLLEAVLTPDLEAQWPHAAKTYAFLTKFYGTGVAKPLTEPLDTVTCKDRFLLVIIEGTPHAVVDIRTRMLTPRELARAQGFPDTYQLVGSKTDQVARIGNSVPPGVVEALVRANTTPAVRAGIKRRRELQAA